MTKQIETLKFVAAALKSQEIPYASQAGYFQFHQGKTGKGRRIYLSRSTPAEVHLSECWDLVPRLPPGAVRTYQETHGGKTNGAVSHVLNLEAPLQEIEECLRVLVGALKDGSTPRRSAPAEAFDLGL